MKAYSLDLRQRVLAACDKRDGTRAQIATRFDVSIHWIRKILRHRRDTGSIEPKPHGGGRARAFSPQATAKLRQAVVDRNDATLHELGQAAGVQCSLSVIHRELATLGLPRKKKRGGRPNKTAPIS